MPKSYLKLIIIAAALALLAVAAHRFNLVAAIRALHGA